MAESSDSMIKCNNCQITIGLLQPYYGLMKDGKIAVPAACPVCLASAEDMSEIYNVVSVSSSYTEAIGADVVMFDKPPVRWTGRSYYVC